MTRAKRAYEGTDAYEAGYNDGRKAGYNDGWEDCKDAILNWMNLIKEKEPPQNEITKTTKGRV